MSNSYIIKVARPQPICVLALNKQLNKLVGFKRCSLQTTVPLLMNTVMLRRLSFVILFLFFGLFFFFCLSYCTLTYCNLFFSLCNFPIVQLEGSSGSAASVDVPLRNEHRAADI